MRARIRRLIARLLDRARKRRERRFALPAFPWQEVAKYGRARSRDEYLKTPR